MIKNTNRVTKIEEVYSNIWVKEAGSPAGIGMALLANVILMGPTISDGVAFFAGCMGLLSLSLALYCGITQIVDQHQRSRSTSVLSELGGGSARSEGGRPR